MNMHSKTKLILAGFAMCSLIFNAHAETKAPSFQMKADHLKSISKSTTQLNGNVVVRLGRTEIRTDNAKVVIAKHKATVYTDTFVATAKK
ncbi:hypothetical protein Brsp05_03953 [Brucella sp. NBRC 12953]